MPLRLPPPRSFASVRMFQRYDWGRLARFHVLDDRQYRAVQACPRQGLGGSNSVNPRACPALLDPRARCWAGAGSLAGRACASSKARWNILAQQTLMAQSSAGAGCVAGRRPLLDRWLGWLSGRAPAPARYAGASRAANPLVLGGDVHTFYASELRRDFGRPASKANPLMATEFVGTSVTSSSRPQQRTAQYVAMNPHIRYGRSDKRGYMLLEVTPKETRTRFMGLDECAGCEAGSGAGARSGWMDGRPAWRCLRRPCEAQGPKLYAHCA
jgi:alkaline phosphatase D